MQFLVYCKNREKYDEAFLGSLQKGFKTGFNQAQQGVDQNYEKYSDVAKQALAKAGGTAKMLSQKTGVPLPLATALVAAGITGGPAAIPFAALLYFVKQPLMKGANKAFDATWDTGAKAVQGVKNAVSGNKQQTPQVQLQPESFKAFVEADSWGDWAGEKLGSAAGTVAGKTSGYGAKIGSSIGNRIKEIGQYAKNNPKEVARMAFLVGAGAAIGAGVGKISHEVKDFIVQSIKNQGIDPKVAEWLHKSVVLEPSGSGKAQGETLSSDDGSNVHHSTHLNAKGHRVHDDMTVGRDQAVNPSGKFQTTSAGSSAGTNNVTQIVGVENQPDVRDTYRDAARLMQQSKDSDATSSLLGSQVTQGQNASDIRQYGQSASAEVAKRVAAAKYAADNLTRPAAIAGGVVGGTGNKNTR